MGKVSIARQRGLKKTVENMARSAYGEMLDYCRTRFRIPDIWVPELGFGWGDLDRLSWSDGHQTWLNLELAVPQFLNGHRPFLEYQEFMSDAEIGDIDTGDWRDSIRALVAHETAHAAWYVLRERVDCDDWQSYLLDHGGLWQGIYRELRRDLVNPATKVGKGVWAGPDRPRPEIKVFWY